MAATSYAKAKIQYNLSDFNGEEAANGGLCVMVKNGTTGNIWTEDANLKGAGVCNFQQPGRYTFTVNDEIFLFDSSGNSTSANTLGWVLKKGTIINAGSNLTPYGSIIKSPFTAVSKRISGNPAIAEVDIDKSSTVRIDGLNARDLFAIQALRGIMYNIKDPAVLSDATIAHYCNTAYKWAANMMLTSAEARASVAEGETSTTAKAVAIGSLDTTTEKLLNNLIVALEKTDEARTEISPIISVDPVTKDTDDEESASAPSIDPEPLIKTTYYERISIPDLITWLNAYTKHTPVSDTDTSTTVGLDDLITAINNLSDNLVNSLKSVTDELKNLTTAVNNINKSDK